jgi:acylphosphatase
MSNEQKRLHAIVHGEVQGVSFRAYTIDEARRLGLTGWVRNLPDDTVEVTAEGSQPQLDKLLTWLHRGSPAARVTQVDADWAAAQNTFIVFEIRYGAG